MISLHKPACNTAFNMIFGYNRYPVSLFAFHDTKKEPQNDSPMSAEKWNVVCLVNYRFITVDRLSRRANNDLSYRFLSSITVERSRIFSFNSHGLTISAISPYIIIHRTKPSIKLVRKVISIIPSTSFSDTKPL